MEEKSQQTPFFEVKDLQVSYVGVPNALNQASLEIKEKNIVALFGINGAGKSTLLRAICGLIPFMGGRIDQGMIKLKDEALHNLKSYQILKKGIAMVPEGRRIFKELTVEENLLIGAYIQYKKKGVPLKMIYEYFPVLLEKRRIHGGNLSGGEQQMLAISRALMCNPTLLLIDELSLGLAPLIVRHLFRLIQQLRNSEGKTILLVEQNVPAALPVCEYAYILEIGRIGMSGTPDEIRSNEDVWHYYLK